MLRQHRNGIGAVSSSLHQSRGDTRYFPRPTHNGNPSAQGTSKAHMTSKEPGRPDFGGIEENASLCSSRGPTTLYSLAKTCGYDKIKQTEETQEKQEIKEGAKTCNETAEEKKGRLISFSVLS